MKANHLVPLVVGSTTFGERALDIYSRLLADRMVMIGGPIEDETANLIVAQLLHLEADDHQKPISLYINSPGGSVHAGLAIYDTLRYIGPEVTTCAVGMAMSMAAVLLAAGTPGRRFALPNAKIMIHQGSGGAQGSPADIEIHAREVLAARRRVAEILAEHTGRSVAQIEDDIDRDHFMSPQEALDYGLIDDVLTSRADSRLVHYRPTRPIGLGNGRSG